MGEEQEKWRRALLKKLRGAAGVKARIDAGDGASLQRSQLAKGTASAVADLVARCVEAGLARDGPEIAEALAAGADGGIVAMAAANARGPDGEPGARARRKRERAAALAAASSSGAGGGGGEDAKRTRLDDGDRARGSKRASGECKRATWALHALAKAPDADPASVAVAAEALTTAMRDSTRDSGVMDALLASVALYAAAKLQSSERVAEGGGHAHDGAIRFDARRELRACASRVAALLAKESTRLCARIDARGASNALWALATLASFGGSNARVTLEGGVGERERRDATRALVGALNGRPELRAAFNARDAANALWGCAKARVGLSDDATTQLASAVASAPEGGGANAVEASMALWALASMRGDGTIDARSARLAATGIVRRLAESVKSFTVTRGATINTGEVDQHRVVANASWAAAKLSEREGTGLFFPGPLDVDDDFAEPDADFDAAATGLLRRFASAAVEAGPAFQLESPRAAAQLVAALRPSLLSLAACVGTHRDDDSYVDDDVVAATTILANRGLRSCFARGREEMEKEARGTRSNAGANGATEKGKRKHPESIQKPSSDDLAAFCEAAEALRGLGVGNRIDAGNFRSAVCAACTGGATALGWRAAGRLEHCVFSVLGLGAVAATVNNARRGSQRGQFEGAPVPSADDVAAAERLLRRGAAAAEAANDTRLAMETAAADVLLAAPDFTGPVGTPVGTPTRRMRMLCVDDTYRLLSRALRERGNWSVTNWNRFSRKDRRGAVKPPAGAFDAATVRLPPTKAAFAMAAVAVAARLRAGGVAWIYGADREGIRGCETDGLPDGLFEDVRVVHASSGGSSGGGGGGLGGDARVTHVEDSTGSFAVLRCVRTEKPSGGSAGTGVPGSSSGAVTHRLKNGTFDEDLVESFKRVGRLDVRLGANVHAFERWVTYPGLFAGGGLDVMTAFLLETMTRSSDGWLGRSLRNEPGCREAFSALDFCSGSGTLAACVRRLAPSARLTLLDADAIAMRAARENLGSPAGASGRVGSSSSPQDERTSVSVHLPPTMFALGDGWTGLSDDERFDVIASNPPVHLGLRPEFTVLTSMCAGFDARLRPGGEAWFVAQRYVPVAGICAGIGGLAARVVCVRASDKFAVWWVRKPGAGEEDAGERMAPKKEKKEKKEKSGKKERKEKSGGKEKKEKSGGKEKKEKSGGKEKKEKKERKERK